MSVLAATVLVGSIVVAVFWALAVARRRMGEGGVAGSDVAAAQRNFLASNWDAVEEAAARSGMDAAEIAEVRKRLLGV